MVPCRFFVSIGNCIPSCTLLFSTVFLPSHSFFSPSFFDLHLSLSHIHLLSSLISFYSMTLESLLVEIKEPLWISDPRFLSLSLFFLNTSCHSKSSIEMSERMRVRKNGMGGKVFRSDGFIVQEYWGSMNKLSDSISASGEIVMVGWPIFSITQSLSSLLSLLLLLIAYLDCRHANRMVESWWEMD